MALGRQGSVQRAARIDRRDALLAGTPHKGLWLQLLALRWPVALASAAIMPFALPLSANAVTLAGFVALIGGAVLVSSLSWLIVFLPVLAALGPYFLELNVAGVNLFGFRLLIIILAVFSTPLTSRSAWWFNPVARYTILFMILWAVYGLLSLLWSPDHADGQADVLTMMFGLGLILALFNLKCYTPKNLDMLRFGWIFAFIVVMAQASWELLTGDHLQSFMTEYFADYLDSSVVQATLGTPTAFGGFLLLATPFVLWSMERARGPEKLCYVGLLAATGFWMLYSASRISFIGLVLLFVFYFLILERRWSVRFAAVACGVVAIGLGTSMLMQSEFKLGQKLDTAASNDYMDSSIIDRLTLTANGFWMAYKTMGRGVGAAGFEEELTSGDVLIQRQVNKRDMKSDAHNFWIELLSEYGLIPFAAFMALLAWFGRLGWRACRQHGRQHVARRSVGRAVVLGLIAYVFYGVGSGSILRASTHWMFLATLAVLAASLYDQKRRPRQPLRQIAQS
jgi:teichuronic acid biosynthesis protein TuaE